MTSPSPDHAPTGARDVPPPGCPAHGLVSDELLQLDGPEGNADPRGMYEKLRKKHGSVAPVALADGTHAWLVLGYDENREVMRNSSVYSRDSRLWTQSLPENSPLAPTVQWQPVCVFADGEEHQRLREALTASLDRCDRRGLRRHITRFANQLVDSFETGRSGGRVDLVAEFAEQLPMLVMTQLFGMPEEYGPDLVTAARDLMKGTENAQASNAFLVEKLEELVARKKSRPGPDIASWLLQHPANLTEEEVMQHLRLILVAANETTVSLISSVLEMNLTDARFRGSLAGGQMTLSDGLQHVLWDRPPLSVVPGRWATGDTRLGGQDIKAGDMLLLGLAAANTDPAVRPDLSEPMHGNSAHLTFSLGSHECPGGSIGRAITETGIDVLLERLPDLRLGVEPRELTRTSSWLSQRLDTLPATFTHRNEPKTINTRTKKATAPKPEAVSPVADDSENAGRHPRKPLFRFLARR
ncbi:cytochrome P450 [Streptomyces sp. TP-A0874]|uniref:cytochrome P450 n=1 Tax=Streptomyces sp. TP-A0874 TaxID=549819 RepID=UPI0008532E37|nr:cytochrome P450 [Streptomyces sp. TP-A0874]